MGPWSLGPSGRLTRPATLGVGSAFQCSYCTPGFLLTASRLLEEHPDATEPQVRAYLSGNLCRCGSYVKILDAVMETLRRRRGG
jgi:aerobic carbon-monoxide dehydrogenase small subunit